MSSLHQTTGEQTLTLWAWEAVGRPAEGMSICAQDGVLLLHPKPGVLVLHRPHDLVTAASQVCF